MCSHSCIHADRKDIFCVNLTQVLNWGLFMQPLFFPRWLDCLISPFRWAIETADQLPPFYHHNNWKLAKKTRKQTTFGENVYFFHNAFPCTQGRAQVQFSQIDSNIAYRQFSQRRVRSLAWGSAGRTWPRQRWKAWSCSWSAWCRRCTLCWQSWCRSSRLPPSRTWAGVIWGYCCWNIEALLKYLLEDLTIWSSSWGHTWRKSSPARSCNLDNAM